MEFDEQGSHELQRRNGIVEVEYRIQRRGDHDIFGVGPQFVVLPSLDVLELVGEFRDLIDDPLVKQGVVNYADSRVQFESDCLKIWHAPTTLCSNILLDSAKLCMSPVQTLLPSVKGAAQDLGCQTTHLIPSGGSHRPLRSPIGTRIRSTAWRLLPSAMLCSLARRPAACGVESLTSPSHVHLRHAGVCNVRFPKHGRWMSDWPSLWIRSVLMDPLATKHFASSPQPLRHSSAGRGVLPRNKSTPRPQVVREERTEIGSPGLRIWNENRPHDRCPDHHACRAYVGWLGCPHGRPDQT